MKFTKDLLFFVAHEMQLTIMKEKLKLGCSSNSTPRAWWVFSKTWINKKVTENVLVDTNVERTSKSDTIRKQTYFELLYVSAFRS